ncbi:hypothetical protein [Glutamicibacter arilaitensis]|uniref:hypothetical protein n=1 Tax=Glutamicibacter arilaitensis TaxID=256701 RepID=UPI00384F6C8A
MSFVDKAKELFDKLKDQTASPEKPGVGEEEPSDAASAVQYDEDPVVGADPDLDPSSDDQYDNQ